MKAKFQELSRVATPGKVQSSYAIGNLTLHLTSRFRDEVVLEDAMFDIIMNRLRSQEKSEAKEAYNGLSDEKVV